MRAVLRVAGYILLGGSLGALSACGEAPGKPTAETATAVPVEIQTAQSGSMSAAYSGTATLEAEAEATVVAKVGGELKQLLVEEGAQVARGGSRVGHGTGRGKLQTGAASPSGAPLVLVKWWRERGHGPIRTCP